MEESRFQPRFRKSRPADFFSFLFSSFAGAIFVFFAMVRGGTTRQSSSRERPTTKRWNVPSSKIMNRSLRLFRFPLYSYILRYSYSVRYSTTRAASYSSSSSERFSNNPPKSLGMRVLSVRIGGAAVMFPTFSTHSHRPSITISPEFQTWVLRAPHHG